MEATTETKQGYKKTKIGSIPESWKLGKVSSFISKLDSGISVNCIEESSATADNRRLLKTSSITSGVLKLSESKVPALNERNKLRCSLKAGQILVCRKNTPELVGVSVFLLESRDEYYIPDLIWQSQANSDNHLLFLYHLLQTDRTRFAISCRANGSSRSMVNISKGSFLGIQVAIPSLPEQQKIAQILSTWDKAIEQSQNLIDKLKYRKKGLMQQLLTGKTRLKGYCEDWKRITFNEIYKSKKEKAGTAKHLVLSVTKNGIVSQADYFNKEIASNDLSPYLVLKKGDMVMSGLNFWMGAIDVLNDYEIGLVSPAYKTFEIVSSSISPLFMRFFVRSEVFLKALVGSSVQGASIVRRNLDKETLENWPFDIPSIKEQIDIAKVLTTADNEIKAQESYLSQLQAQKKGLMQQLLTGQKRVTIN